MDEKIAIDIALLLPTEINEICQEINQKENSERFSDLSKSNNHPHITLAMGVIKKTDIENISKKLNKIANLFPKLSLEISKIYSQITPEKKISYAFEIKTTEEIKKLHAHIMKEISPMFSYITTKEMFYLDKDEIFNKVSKTWVENYSNKHSNPENYHPHISLKCRNAEYLDLPIKFTASVIALCHLGNYCTCRTIFSSEKLK